MRLSGHDSEELAEALLDVLRGMHQLMRQPLPPGHQEDASGASERGGHSLLEKPGQFKLLMVLTKRGRLTMQELATALGVAPPSVTGMIRRLLEQGYVKRVRDESDWRTVWVELTEQGREAVTRHHRERVAALRQRIEQLDSEEREKLRDAIPVLSHLLELQPRVADAVGLTGSKVVMETGIETQSGPKGR